MQSTEADATEQHNQRVLSTGTWIDAAFLEDVLRTRLQEEVHVVDHHVTAAVAAGDNYLSILYRTSVTYTSDSNELQQRFLVIKGVPTGDNLLIMLEIIGAFDKEIKIYNEALPLMQQYQAESFTDDSELVAPEPYPCSRPDTLVMEDISKSGYRMASRMDQLDLEHCMVTLRTLARFHALSVKLYNEHPDIVMDITAKEVYSEPNRISFGKLLDEIFPVLTTAMGQWGEDGRFASRMNEIGRFIWDKLVFAIRSSEHLNVLNHGDLWVNNVMFKYDEDGVVSSAKLLDFQMSRFTTPALDLLYFFFTSPKADVLTNHMPELLQVYHDTLTGDLAMLGVNVDYPLQQLEEDVKDRFTYGIAAMAQILPLVLSPASDAIDFGTLDASNMKPEDHPMAKNYLREQYRISVGKILKYMDATGYLDAAVDRMAQFIAELEAQNAIVEPEEAVIADSRPRPRTAQQQTFIERMFRILSQPICE